MESKIKMLAGQYFKAYELFFNSLMKLRRAQGGVSWKKPHVRVMKLNKDESSLTLEHLAIVGGVLRDSEGNWLCGFKARTCIFDVITTEL